MENNWTGESPRMESIELQSNLTNTSVSLQENFQIDLEDTNWILTSSFIIFTMQTGFGMLESGCVSIKNEANIMMKNMADISLGGLTYWIFGYGLSYGEGKWSNPVVGVGDFLVDPPVGDALMGPVFASFLFQLSFATTATTIVSGAMAERCNFKAYCLFSFLNTVVYCVPAGWVWGEHGFLNKLGAVDIAGSGPVHLIGGSSAFASALMLGPRLGRYAHGTAPLPLGNPVNAIMGTFVLWWGWLAFNSGSTYGVSGAKWQYAARASVMTMMGSCGGGVFGILFTMIKNKGRADVMELINSVLGSLVAVTAGCFLYRAWEALVIGAIGALVTSLAGPLIDRLRVDDPVGASAVHGAAGLWGVIAVGLFADNPIPMETTNGRSGLFKGGGWYLLGVQTLMAVCLMAWALSVTMLLLWIIDKVLPIRMDPYEELLGADLTDHRIRHGNIRDLQLLNHHKFTNKGFDELTEPNVFKNNGFLNKRPGNPENDLHKAIDSMSHEIGNPKKETEILGILPEGIKGKRLKELTESERAQCEEFGASEDRFRHKFTKDHYKRDQIRGDLPTPPTVAWVE
ncbi:putative ammonium transporter 3 [Aricia agestis]|uniref:putative ammonium transporter 3 n=1 Tax=Aricia agestis TaxID=91739 RepID=UPI001C208F0D|nr:putative ammonium transporter 3 [Aricia agestis]